MAKMRDSGKGIYNAVCDVCGWVYKSNELKKRWDGYMVCKYDWEPRNILDFYRTINDSTKLPFTRPELDEDLWTAGAALNCERGQGALWTPPGSFYRAMPFTMECMIYVRAVFTGQTQISMLRYLGGYLYRLTNTDGVYTPDFLYYDDVSGNRYRHTSALVIPPLTWVRVNWIMTSGASSTIVISYLNSAGTLVTTSETVVPTSVVNAAARSIAGFGDDLLVPATEGLIGMLDDFRLWGVARSVAECQADWDQEVQSTATNLISYWQFNNQSTNTVPSTTTSDSVITTNTATLQGATLVPHTLVAAA